MNAFTPAKSDLLNQLRWLSALLVVVGHVDMYFLQLGVGAKAIFGYAGMHAHAAVMIFFVLSGYVVAYSLQKKKQKVDYRFRSYFLDRWSRIYSVLIIAVFFTAGLDAIGARLDGNYSDAGLVPQNAYVIRGLANIFALQGLQGYRIQFGSNPALWSVGYEFAFYILFGVWSFRRHLFKPVWISCVVIFGMLLILGWKIAFYYLIWLMGVWAYNWSEQRRWRTFEIHGWLALVLIGVANHFLIFLNIFSLPENAQDALFALVVASMLMCGVRNGRTRHLFIRAFNTFMADFSYSLYAFHMPVIFFICSVFAGVVYASTPVVSGICLIFSCLAVARFFYWAVESRRSRLRAVGDKVLKKFGI